MMSSGSTVTVRVQMLDNSIHMYDVKLNSNGIVLLQAVLKDLNLLEADYFGILYRNGESDEFLDPLKKLKLQIPNISTTVLKFAVKFFPPDPGQLQEEYTRYLFALQIKQDILHGQLTCTDNTLAVLTSCIVQSEFGDWNAQECSDLTYLKDLKILPDKPNEGNILVKISEHHKTNMGLTSAEADAHLLDIVRRVELYGLRLQPAVDPAKTKISLAVSFAGVVVLQNNSRINLFSWSLIRKLSFKKNKLLVKLKAKLSSDKYYADSGDVLVFVMKSRDACKSFWRRCIEHHSFFRVEEHRPRKGPPPRLLRKGSTYRYTGKTQKQLHDLVSSSNFSRSSFNRASRRRTTASKNNESVFSPSIQETSTNLENSFKSSIPGNDDSVHTKPPGFTSLEITNHDKSEGSVVLSRDTSSGPTMTSWQEKSGDLRSGNNAVAPHNGKLDSAGNPSFTSAHARTNAVLRNPDLLNDVSSAVLRDRNSNANDNSELAENKVCVRNDSEELNSGSNTSRKSFNYPLPPPPPPPPESDGRSSPYDYAFNDDLPSPPPLPPKLGSSLSNQQFFEEKQKETENSVPTSSGTRDQLSLSRSSSAESIPGVYVKEPRTPSQYEVVEKQLIQAGFYSVPSKPPIVEPVDENMDPIQQALDELDRAAKSLMMNSVDISESGSSVETNSVDDSRHFNQKRKRANGQTSNCSYLPSSLSPKSNEHCLSPVYPGSADGFAVELEASFERIRNGMSSYSSENETHRDRDKMSSYLKANSKEEQTRVKLSNRTTVDV